MNSELEERRFAILEAQINNLIKEQENTNSLLERLISLEEANNKELQGICSSLRTYLRGT